MKYFIKFAVFLGFIVPAVHAAVVEFEASPLPQTPHSMGTVEEGNPLDTIVEQHEKTLSKLERCVAKCQKLLQEGQWFIPNNNHGLTMHEIADACHAQLKTLLEQISTEVRKHADTHPHVGLIALKQLLTDNPVHFITRLDKLASSLRFEPRDMPSIKLLSLKAALYKKICALIEYYTCHCTDALNQGHTQIRSQHLTSGTITHFPVKEIMKECLTRQDQVVQDLKHDIALWKRAGKYELFIAVVLGRNGELLRKLDHQTYLVTKNLGQQIKLHNLPSRILRSTLPTTQEESEEAEDDNTSC